MIFVCIDEITVEKHNPHNNIVLSLPEKFSINFAGVTPNMGMKIPQQAAVSWLTAAVSVHRI
jgi:hypothetical protein